MRTDPFRQALYVCGRRAWYRRFLALTVYAAVVLAALIAYESVRRVLGEPGLGNLGLCALTALLLGAWSVGVRAAWRDGQSRVTRIALSVDRTLFVRTLNFTSRRAPLAALGDVEYESSWTSADGDVDEPLLTVHVRGESPIKVDLRGRIPDEQGFEAVFRYGASQPPAARRGRWKASGGDMCGRPLPGDDRTRGATRPSHVWELDRS